MISKSQPQALASILLHSGAYLCLLQVCAFAGNVSDDATSVEPVIIRYIDLTAAANVQAPKQDAARSLKSGDLNLADESRKDEHTAHGEHGVGGHGGYKSDWVTS